MKDTKSKPQESSVWGFFERLPKSEITPGMIVFCINYGMEGILTSNKPESNGTWEVSTIKGVHVYPQPSEMMYWKSLKPLQ